MFTLLRQKDPSFLEATRKEQHNTVERLIELGTFRSGYFVMLMLATLIVVPGLLLNNVTVVIGGMILAPLMIPILSLSLSVVSGSVRGALRSLQLLLLSIIIPLITAWAITLAFSKTYNVITWIPERIDPGIYTFIAFCSGVAGTLAWIKENLSASIAGVAVAVALLPPLCAAGIAIGLSEPVVLKNSLLLFFANLTGIAVASFLVFLTLGFLGAGEIQKKAIDDHS